jgi:hypothetical protein
MMTKITPDAAPAVKRSRRSASKTAAVTPAEAQTPAVEAVALPIAEPAPGEATAAAVPEAPPAKPATSRKRATRSPAKKAAAEAPAEPAAPHAEPEKPARPAKEKLVRDSFTMPRADFALIGQLKERALGFKRHTKKSELLRAGLQALTALPDPALRKLLDSLPTLKAGRPKKGG